MQIIPRGHDGLIAAYAERISADPFSIAIRLDDEIDFVPALLVPEGESGTRHRAAAAEPASYAARFRRRDSLS